MLVRSIKLGYYGGSRRRPGDVFSINEKEFSKTWMVKVEEDAKPQTPATKEGQRVELFPTGKEKGRGALSGGVTPNRDVI